MDQHQSYPSLLPSPRQPFSHLAELDAWEANLTKHAVSLKTLTPLKTNMPLENPHVQ